MRGKTEARQPTATGTRAQMIEAAIALMRRTGLTGAGINEVVRESGAPKGSLYHFFPGGKQQLARDALAVYADRVREFIDAALAARRTPRTKVEGLFEAFAVRFEARACGASCAAGAVSLDLDAEAEVLRSAVRSAFDQWTATIAAHFGGSKSREAHAFAGLVLTAIEGAYVRGRAEGSAAPFREAGPWLGRLAAETFEDASPARSR